MATLNSISHNTDYDLTPSRKRKRQFEKLEQKEQEKAIKVTAAATTSCFTNAAFSSTPKKIVGKRRLQVNTNKENTTDFPNVGLEVKSISEIAKHREEKQNIPQNPYEVLRKPPKKKKRHTEETACFENPALNLELPEKQFNPYEVKRDITPHKNSNCFSNPALNLKIQDASAIRNPFEVQRETLAEKNVTEPALLNPFEIPIENEKQAVVTTPKPCKLKLGLPFVPTVGCRIDFKDISMSQLTPSKLLAEKLVFSPVVKPKVSLGSIGEETTMDIGKELDRYQLELENSINEAKLRKNGIVDEEIPLTPPDSNFQIQIVDIEKKSKLTQKLCGISEDGETEEVIEEITQQTEEHHTEMRLKKEENNEQKGEIISDNNPFLYDINTQLQRTETAEVIEIENLDDLYGCSADDQVDEDSFDFKTPAPFVRAYTKPVEAIQNLKVSKESLTSNKTDNSDEMEDQGKKHLNVKNIIRKSIRKLMHPHQHDEQHSASNEKDLLDKPEHEKHNGLMNAIRQSLRRKPSKNLTDEGTPTKECEISIIDTTERTMKLKSDALQTEYVKIEDLTNEKKHNLRNSIRKSTRDVRNQILKSVFHKKHEEYDFKK